MKLRRWFSQRGPEFIRRRAGALVRRYGITPYKAEARIQRSVAVMAEYGCSPTFPTPARVVDTYPDFIRSLQRAGAEIAVHSYDHLDLKGYRPEESREQLLRAADAFERNGIEIHGFRCPYLSWTPELLDVLPAGRFGYSSNQAIWFDSDAVHSSHDGPILKTIGKFYAPLDGSEVVCVPHNRAGLIEIPVCVPDDLQLLDGLQLGPEDLSRAWCDMLHLTYRRGESFTLIFHPELAERCEDAFRILLGQARNFRPPVWIARLCDISEWWREKATFGTDLTSTPAGWRLSFQCSPRATILAKDLPVPASAEAWAGSYFRLAEPVLEVSGSAIPLLGLPADAPVETVRFLEEQGYILRIGELGPQCSVYLDSQTLAGLRTEVALVDFIEACPGPLVRYWRWPNGARSTLSLTGDLDALSLVDYARRLLTH